MNIQSRSIPYRLAHLWAASLLLVCTLSHAGVSAHSLNREENHCHDKFDAPPSLANKKMVLKIESFNSEKQGASPIKGAIVQTYAPEGKFTAETFGNDVEQTGAGAYAYRRESKKSSSETLFDAVTGESTRTIYHFETPAAGTWDRSADGGLTRLSGRFDLSPIDQSKVEVIAPENHHGITVALSILNTVSDLPPEAYPRQGVVLQSYNQDGTYTGLGFGPGTINHHGTYSYRRIAPNIAVEKTVQVADFFTLPFTMVYTYETPRSGTWYQDFGNSLILFSGSFTTFETN
jgi:hypothetical protein